MVPEFVRSAGRDPDVAIRSRVRTARPQGVERIDHERKRFKIDLNFLDGFRGGEFVDCGHSKNRFALIKRLIGKAAFAPLAGLDHRSIVGKGIGRGGKIVRRENAFDARHGERRVRIDALYPGMRHWAEQQLAEQHAFRSKVLGIFRLAGNLRIEIWRRIVLADQLVAGPVLALSGLGSLNNLFVIHASPSANSQRRASSRSESCRSPGSGTGFPTCRAPTPGGWDWDWFSDIPRQS